MNIYLILYKLYPKSLDYIYNVQQKIDETISLCSTKVEVLVCSCRAKAQLWFKVIPILAVWDKSVWFHCPELLALKEGATTPGPVQL